MDTGFGPGKDRSAPAPKLGVVLMPKAEAERRTPAQLHSLDPMWWGRAAEDDSCRPDFSDVAKLRGASSKGGTLLQLLSCARWVRAPPPPADRGAAGAEAPPVLPGTAHDGRPWSNRDVDQDAVRFWLLQSDLQHMQGQGWCAHTIACDTWRATTVRAVPLSSGARVRSVGLPETF